ncbi:MAG TPA: tyrosine-protein phosphatase [Pyrinomonadaceae bacterium]|nr:tyrosine-protein phosphatase [Pyrinomonadaceae bacterium]
MKSNNLRILAFVLIAFSFAGLTPAQKKPVGEDLPNFSEVVKAKLYRGAQPTEEGVKKLAQMGVKTIIDLRGADERAKREETWARSAGLKFINVPLNNWFGPPDEKIAEIEKLINAPENQPVFVHCQRGADRTGTVIAVYRITNEDWTAQRAEEEAKKFGFGWWQFWMKDYINDYYRDFKK